MTELIITEEQMRLWRSLRLTRFQDALVLHMWRHFPAACEAMGSGGVVAAVETGITRAQEYGFGTELAVCKYVSIMFAFHPDFDRDPELAWAQGILQGPRTGLRIDHLVDAALAHQTRELVLPVAGG